MVVLTAGSVAWAQPLGPPLPKGPNVIVGRLVDSRDDAPVGGAIVTITGYAGEGSAPRRDTPASAADPAFAPRNVMTAADGRFVLRDLPAGRYAIAASAFGYIDNTLPQHWVDVADDESPTETTVRIWKAASISGVVTDERGEPVVGVLVSAMRHAAGEGRQGLTRVRDAITDDRGEYRIGTLQPGAYIVGVLSSSVSIPEEFIAGVDERAGNASAAFQFRAVLLRSGLRPEFGPGLRQAGHSLLRTGPVPSLTPDGRLLSYAASFYPGTSRVDGAIPVRLGSGDSQVGINLGVRFVPAVSVSGSVSSPDGPLQNTLVRLLPAGADLAESFESFGGDGAVSDTSGRFTLLAIPPGEYDLSVAMRVGEEESSILLTADERITVPEEGLSGVQVTARPGPAVTGRVAFSPASADTPRPERIRVGLRPVGAGSWRGLPVIAGSDGAFEVSADRPGAYEVFVATGPPWAIDRVTINGRVVPDAIITVADNGLRGVEVTLTHAHPTVTGRVTTDQGQPDTASVVIVFPTDGAAWRKGLFNDRRVRLVNVSSSGTYASPLPAGDYYVAAVPVRFTYEWRTPDFLQRLSTLATTITLRDGETRTLALKPVTPGGR